MFISAIISKIYEKSNQKRLTFGITVRSFPNRRFAYGRADFVAAESMWHPFARAGRAGALRPVPTALDGGAARAVPHLLVWSSDAASLQLGCRRVAPPASAPHLRRPSYLASFIPCSHQRASPPDLHHVRDMPLLACCLCVPMAAASVRAPRRASVARTTGL